MKKVIRLTESDLVNIVKRVINEQKDIQEIFGLSKKEKLEKKLKTKVNQAKEEIRKYDFSSLFKEPKENPDNEHFKKLVKIGLNNAKSEMPTLNELCPDLFEFEGRTGAMSCLLKMKNDNKLRGIIPTNFSIICNRGTLMDNSEAKEKMISYLDDKLKHEKESIIKRIS